MIGQLVYFVEIVSNGQEAVERVMEAQASDTPFDLVLMDIQMPKLNGIEATRQMRREGFKAPIVALTAGGNGIRTRRLHDGWLHIFPC